MRVGKLRHRITIEKQAKGKNLSGESRLDEWEPVLPPVWANISDLTGRDKINDLTTSEIDARGYLRWRNGIHAGMRVKHRDRYYLITNEPIDRMGTRSEMELLLRMMD